MSYQETDGPEFQAKEGQLRNFDIKFLNPLNRFIKQYMWGMKEYVRWKEEVMFIILNF